MTSKIFLTVAILYLAGKATALPRALPQALPQAGVKDTQVFPLHAYEYQIIPNDQYAVTEYNNNNALSLWNLITDPITALSTIISTALSVTGWILWNGSMVLFGMALVVGFCAFTPYCTMTIDTSTYRKKRSAINIPYYDNIENYFNDAINKYDEMQKA